MNLFTKNVGCVSRKPHGRAAARPYKFPDENPAFGPVCPELLPAGRPVVPTSSELLSNGLPTFTFRQVGVKEMEFQAVPGPEARALRGKIMRHRSFLGSGGQAVLSPRRGVFRCRGARPGARAARPILRKPRRISGWNSFPTDAFSAQSRQRRDFRATSSVWSKKKI